MLNSDRSHMLVYAKRMAIINHIGVGLLALACTLCEAGWRLGGSNYRVILQRGHCPFGDDILQYLLAFRYEWSMGTFKCPCCEDIPTFVGLCIHESLVVNHLEYQRSKADLKLSYRWMSDRTPNNFWQTENTELPKRTEMGPTLLDH